MHLFYFLIQPMIYATPEANEIEPKKVKKTSNWKAARKEKYIKLWVDADTETKLSEKVDLLTHSTFKRITPEAIAKSLQNISKLTNSQTLNLQKYLTKIWFSFMKNFETRFFGRYQPVVYYASNDLKDLLIIPLRKEFKEIIEKTVRKDTDFMTKIQKSNENTD